MQVEGALDQMDKYKIAVDTNNYNIALAPVVQSGGEYNVHITKGGLKSSGADFSYDVILFSMGMKYETGVAIAARTFFIDPTPSQQRVYDALLKAQHVRPARTCALLPCARRRRCCPHAQECAHTFPVLCRTPCSHSSTNCARAPSLRTSCWLCARS
ncbi:M24 family metallopeptidase [archaeon]|nr:MAG: M24 family metallopeptidase [archaeon]